MSLKQKTLNQLQERLQAISQNPMTSNAIAKQTQSDRSESEHQIKPPPKSLLQTPSPVASMVELQPEQGRTASAGLRMSVESIDAIPLQPATELSQIGSHSIPQRSRPISPSPTSRHRPTSYIAHQTRLKTPLPPNAIPPGEPATEPYKSEQFTANTIPVQQVPQKLSASLQENLSANWQQALEAQGEQISQLSTAQEEAMRELKRQTDWIDRALHSPSILGEYTPESPSQLDSPDDSIPYARWGDRHKSSVNNQSGTSNRKVNGCRDEQEAAQMATFLRQRTAKSTAKPGTSPVRKRKLSRNRPVWQAILRSLVQTILKLGQGFNQGISTLPKASKSRPTASASVPVFTLQDGVLWLGSGIIVRVMVELLLFSFPGLWFPVVGIVVTPAAIALYQTRSAPQFGFTWACRLFVLMIGLLLGGRLL
jgi:hypothetical protein